MAARTSVLLPLPEQSRPGCGNTPNRFLPRTGVACFVLLNLFKSGGLQGEKMGLQSSSSPPLTPYLSNLTQAREQKEVIGSCRNSKMACEHLKRIY